MCVTREKVNETRFKECCNIEFNTLRKASRPTYRPNCIPEFCSILALGFRANWFCHCYAVGSKSVFPLEITLIKLGGGCSFGVLFGERQCAESMPVVEISYEDMMCLCCAQCIKGGCLVGLMTSSGRRSSMFFTEHAYWGISNCDTSTASKELDFSPLCRSRFVFTN